MIDPCGRDDSKSDCAKTALLQGVIQPATARALRTWLSKHKPRIVVLDSPGGDLAASMDMGRVIREKRLDTVLMSEIVTWDKKTSAKRVVSSEALCTSACAYAFLGGRNRVVMANARLGVTQFGGNYGSSTASTTQKTILAVTDYVTSMGARRELVDLALGADPYEPRFLTVKELVDYRVDTVREHTFSIAGLSEENQVRACYRLMTSIGEGMRRQGPSHILQSQGTFAMYATTVRDSIFWIYRAEMLKADLDERFTKSVEVGLSNLPKMRAYQDCKELGHAFTDHEENLELFDELMWEYLNKEFGWASKSEASAAILALPKDAEE